MACSIAFSNSRTLPGQLYCISKARASGAIPLKPRLHLAAYLLAKYMASKGMSSRCSRSGGEGAQNRLQQAYTYGRDPTALIGSFNVLFRSPTTSDLGC